MHEMFIKLRLDFIPTAVYILLFIYIILYSLSNPTVYRSSNTVGDTNTCQTYTTIKCTVTYRGNTVRDIYACQTYAVLKMPILL